jgi:hypothetical protein
VPARGTIHSAPGQLRASCAPVLRPVREVLSLDWDRRARVTPVLAARDLRPSVGAGFFGSCALAASQEAWPGAERKGREPPWQEPRWNADRRAPPPYPPPHAGRMGGGRAASVDADRVSMRLPAFRFPFLRSPDGAERNPGSAFKLLGRSRIALRFIRATGCHKTRARARRENDGVCPPPHAVRGRGTARQRGGGGMLSRGFFSDEGASLTAACPFHRPSGGPPPPQSRALRGRMKRAHVASQ